MPHAETKSYFNSRFIDSRNMKKCWFHQWNSTDSRTTVAQWSLFSLKFVLGQTNWADKFWGTFGIFGWTISTYFGTVSPLSMFSISQSIHRRWKWSKILTKTWSKYDRKMSRCRKKLHKAVETKWRQSELVSSPQYLLKQQKILPRPQEVEPWLTVFWQIYRKTIPKNQLICLVFTYRISSTIQGRKLYEEIGKYCKA